MKKRSLRYIWTTFPLLLMLLAAQPAQGQTIIKVGPRLTLDFGDITDASGDSWGYGGDVRLRSADYPIQANGSLDYYPAGENLTIVAFDVNAVYLFDAEDQAVMPYVGLGLGVVRVSSDIDVGDVDFGGDDTEAGVNLVGGVEFDMGFLTPFVQAQFTNGGDIDRFGITGGLLLTF
jgi:opacity protein-like surface antigen